MFNFRVEVGDLFTPMAYVWSDSDVVYHVVFLHSGNVYSSAAVLEYPLDWAQAYT